MTQALLLRGSSSHPRQLLYYLVFWIAVCRHFPKTNRTSARRHFRADCRCRCADKGLRNHPTRCRWQAARQGDSCRHGCPHKRFSRTNRPKHGRGGRDRTTQKTQRKQVACRLTRADRHPLKPGFRIAPRCAAHIHYVCRRGFRKLRPGDTIDLKVAIDEELSGAFFMTGKVLLEGKTAVRLQFACTLAPATGA